MAGARSAALVSLPLEADAEQQTVPEVATEPDLNPEVAEEALTTDSEVWDNVPISTVSTS